VCLTARRENCDGGGLRGAPVGELSSFRGADSRGAGEDRKGRAKKELTQEEAVSPLTHALGVLRSDAWRAGRLVPKQPSGLGRWRRRLAGPGGPPLSLYRGRRQASLGFNLALAEGGPEGECVDKMRRCAPGG